MRDFVELVTGVPGGDPARGGARRAFDEHMELCPGCDRYLEQYRATIDLLGELPEESLSSPGRERLLDAFAEWRRTSGESGA